MNKKSTIGMVLLVAMVISKAFLFDYKDQQVNFEGVHASVQNVNAFSERASSLKSTSARTDLIAAHFNAPVLSDFQVVVTNNQGNEHFASDYQIDELVINSCDQIASEVIPMDYASNTGYGLWKSSSLEGRERYSSAEKSFEGKMPLDHGNTVSGDMSRLFPRNP